MKTALRCLSCAEYIYGWLSRQQGAVTSLSRMAVVFCTDRLEGTVRLWDEGIAELVVHDCAKEEVLYWNHVSSEDLVALFQAVAAFFQVLQEKRTEASAQTGILPMKLLFVCSSGMSSSRMAWLTNAYAAKAGLPVQAGYSIPADVDFDAWDVVLFAPQCGEAYRKLEGNKKKKALLADTLAYGTADVCGLLLRADDARKKAGYGEL